MNAPSVRHPGRRFTLGMKLGVIFLLLGALIVIGVTVTVLNLSAVRVDAQRMLEENREVRLAYGVVSELERLQSLLSGRPTAEQLRQAAAAIAGARDALDVLDEGAGSEDPSDREHQAAETGMVYELDRQLDAVDAMLARGEADLNREELVPLLEESRALAEGLARETRLEAVEGTRDLDRRAKRLLRVIAGSAALSLLALLLGFWLVERNLVRPVRLLRQGTRAFGAGNLDHRVPARSSDEIGELAREFNRMADRLQGSHRDLERQVEERTHQFLHAARLAGVGTFAAGVAHEVNTPLATIASSAEGLERRLAAGNLDPQTGLDYLRTITREAYRAKDITSRMLAFARKDTGGFSPCRLGSRLDELARMLAPRFTERGIALDLHVAADLPDVLANPSEIDQAVINLLNNALDASQPGGTVWLRCIQRNGTLVVEVEDRGPGVPAEHREEIFDPFFTTKQPGEGTGLGLSLTFRIVERHRGRIEVEDPPDGGALFRLILPAADSRERSA